MRGADVTLVTSMPDNVPQGVKVLCAQTAKEMGDAVMGNQEGFDVIIMAAAIADFRPAEVSDHKIKKTKGLESLELASTHDFLVDLGRGKKSNQTIVGFAAETEDLEKNAFEKLKKKDLDLIYIDSYHEPKHVEKVFFHYYDFLKIGGFCVIDDISWLPYCKNEYRDNEFSETTNKSVFNKILEQLLKFF